MYSISLSSFPKQYHHLRIKEHYVRVNDVSYSYHRKNVKSSLMSSYCLNTVKTLKKYEIFFKATSIYKYNFIKPHLFSNFNHAKIDFIYSIYMRACRLIDSPMDVKLVQFNLLCRFRLNINNLSLIQSFMSRDVTRDSVGNNYNFSYHPLLRRL